MKCPNCGHENGGTGNFCASCGYDLHGVKHSQQIDFDPNNNASQQVSYNQNMNSQNYQQTNYQQNQQQYNTQQSTYQGQNYTTYNHKNMWIAILLNLMGGIFFYFLAGIGQIYLGLFKRGVVIGVIGLLITIISVMIMIAISDTVGSLLSLILGLALVIYSAYDAYQCTNAINDGRLIPLLFGTLDLQ